MKDIINQIVGRDLDDTVIHITKLDHAGVNQVFDIQCVKDNYVIKLNTDPEKEFQYLKEKWCLDNVVPMGALGPRVLTIGQLHKYHYLVLNKLKGINGDTASQVEKIKIWRVLGEYASMYSSIDKMNVPAVLSREFHKSWDHKIKYNLKELSGKDPLLETRVFTLQEQNDIRNAITSLGQKQFTFGLVHGDLCPRNVVFDNPIVNLIDWEMAKIGIVPHLEIGIILVEKVANAAEFDAFLNGMQFSASEFKQMEGDIRSLNLLHRLDLYRWAWGREISHINNYIPKLQEAYRNLI